MRIPAIADPLHGFRDADPKRQRRMLDNSVFWLGRRGAVQSYIKHGLHRLPDGSIKTFTEIADDFFGLVNVDIVRAYMRRATPALFNEIKAAGGDIYG